MAEKTKVTRITATDDTPRAKKGSATAPAAKGKKVTKVAKAKQVREKSEPKNWFTRALFGFGGYFKGAWYELKQVRWPTRKATWGLTLAVIIFSLFFVGLILLLDGGFNYLFELIIGK